MHKLVHPYINWVPSLNSKTHVSLTSCIFLIARGGVLFVWLGDWAERGQGFLYLSSPANIDYRKLGGDLDWIQYRPIALQKQCGMPKAIEQRQE